METSCFEGKRRHRRQPAEGRLDLYAVGQNGTREELPVYLRDISDGGLSGTFFGEMDPRRTTSYFMICKDSGNRIPVRLVWSRSAFENTFLLGFEKIHAS